MLRSKVRCYNQVTLLPGIYCTQLQIVDYCGYISSPKTAILLPAMPVTQTLRTLPKRYTNNPSCK